MRARKIACTLGSAGLLLASMAPAWAQSASVSVIDNSFSPREVEIEAGGTVEWTNDGDAPHTVTADDGSFDSGTMDPGSSYSQTFDQSGRYQYYCQFHGSAGGNGMAGVVVVTGGGNGGTDGGAVDGGSDTNPTDTSGPTDDTGLPATGVEITGFVYLAVALIVAGAALWRLGSDPLPRRR